MIDDLKTLRSGNPDLKLIVSLGGSRRIKSATFSSIAGNEFRLRNLTRSLDDLHEEGLIDGLEINWQWPQIGDGAGKKDRARLLKLARVGFLPEAPAQVNN